MTPTRLQILYIRMLFCWLMLSSGLVAVLNWKQSIKHAATCMGLGLVLIWVAVCGILMWRCREPITKAVSAIQIKWQIRFVLFCTLLALSEEAIATLMTNTAPLYGLKMGQAYITAGTNYLDVISLHGVSLFVSFFVGWAVILTYFRFTPFAVAAIFGVTGTLIEAAFGGPLHVVEYGMWAFVYGLMVWLPAGAIPYNMPDTAGPVDSISNGEKSVRSAPWYLYPIMVFLPMLFVFLFPLLGIISLFCPHHPKLHFPPMP